jgi:hypothetical protein
MQTFISPVCVIKAYRESGGIDPLIINLEISCECSTLRPRHFAPENNPGTHWLGGWVDFRADRDDFEMKQTPCRCRDSSPLPSSL